MNNHWICDGVSHILERVGGAMKSETIDENVYLKLDRRETGDDTEVALRLFKKDDAADLTAAINNKKVIDNLREIPFPYTERDANEFIEAVLAADKETHYVFAITYGGKVIGCISALRMDNVHRQTAELGYYVAEPYWNRGIATGAVQKMCACIFDNTDIIRIFAAPYGYNDASCRVLEKAGFLFEGVMRRNAVKNGKVIDMKLYAIIQDK